MLSTIASATPALADDTEVFFVDPGTITTRPNVLFIVDNSRSMDDRVESDDPQNPQRKIDVVKAVATDMLSTLDGVNIGLMTYNDEEGGHVDYAVENVATARSAIASAVSSIELAAWTPLSETLYEAYRYFSGDGVEYGGIGPTASVDAARTVPGGDLYDTPLEEGCQKSFVVLLSDGLPTRDRGADSSIAALAGGTCDGEPTDGYCLDDLAKYMFENDVNPRVPGAQHVSLFAIGFDEHVPILDAAARASGGAYFEANDAASLTTALKSVLFDIENTAATFAAPAVTVDSFNRTRHSNDLYVGVFAPTGEMHWPGNLKKYRLRPSDGAILDSQTPPRPAVDAAGSFAAGTKSFWSADADGPDVESGGAAANLPPPAAREVYTYLAGGDLNAAGNRVAQGNASVDDALLGTGRPQDPTRAQVIDFIRGADPTTGAPRHQMGDPLHSRPAAVAYNATKTVIYLVTNDGYLHAVNAEDGTEAWAFVPPELLGDQVDLYRNAPTGTRHYGLDGTPRVQIAADDDGEIEPGEKVYLFFGARRGGDFYYGLDVSNPADPQVLWRLPGPGPHALPGLGQSWSNPTPTRIDVAGAQQNAGKLVLVFGAGYDTKHDEYALSGGDAAGAGVFIVDSVSGDALWSGAAAGATASFAKMSYAIPGDIRVVDSDDDGFGDRLYAADLGGQVWRFDVSNGQAAASLVAGGVIAQLGGAPAAAPPLASTRRFYYAPDVALVSGDVPYVHIGIGSGHRERPNSIVNTDRFYALRDYAAFAHLTQAQFDALTPITDEALVDVTSDPSAAIPAGGPGWKLTLTRPGEKVLAEARTFDDRIFFTSFTPGTSDAASCKPPPGTNRLYSISVFNGAPVENLDASAPNDALGVDDRSRAFAGSLASEVTFVFPSPEGPCFGDQCAPPPLACVGLVCFPTGLANNPVRTFWSEESVDP
jgi:type IV pilus assembly protein PilY1